MKTATLRDGLALVGAAGCLLWTGRVVQGAGYGGWVVALLLAVLLPTILCSLSARLPVVVGWLTATCLHLSILAFHPDYRGRLLAARTWETFWARDWDVWLVMWVILVGLSLAVSLPIAVNRSRAAGVARHHSDCGSVQEPRG